VASVATRGGAPGRHPLPRTTRIEELAADGTSCRTYDVGSSDGTRCTSRPLVRGVDGTVGQLSPTCEVLTWPHARP
jgi:hypothetical protein